MIWVEKNYFPLDTMIIWENKVHECGILKICLQILYFFSMNFPLLKYVLAWVCNLFLETRIMAELLCDFNVWLGKCGTASIGISLAREARPENPATILWGMRQPKTYSTSLFRCSCSDSLSKCPDKKPASAAEHVHHKTLDDPRSQLEVISADAK